MSRRVATVPAGRQEELLEAFLDAYSASTTRSAVDVFLTGLSALGARPNRSEV
jgi:hypothetical protein